MAFPSVFSSFPQPTASSPLNAPSHSALHNQVSSAIGQLEAVVGLTGSSSVLGTIEGDLRSPASGGGGHVQTAVLGGTGQTTYNKGDILVAQSASVLARVTVGTDGQVLQANSSVVSGVNWVVNSVPKVALSGSVLTVSGMNETSIFSVTIPGSTLGSNNVLRARLFATFTASATNNVILRPIYGSSSVTTWSTNVNVNPAASMSGIVEYELFGANSPSSQLGVINANLVKPMLDPTSAASSIVGIFQMKSGNINEDSGAAKTFGITAQLDGTSSNFVVKGWTIEKLT